MNRRLLAGLALVLIATACSSGGNDDKSSESTKGTAATALYSGFTSDTYSNAANWLCRPDTDDVCDSGQDATVIAPGADLETETWAPAEEPPVDCFYVYPTVSRDPEGNSDLKAGDDEEVFATVNQVARLGDVCRVFVPIYRQVTLTALIGRIAGTPDAPKGDPEVAYGDVVDAWKQYMANDNDGRGVVLIGHSQGSGLLTRLIKEEIDPNPEARDQLVAAYLGGTTLAVPEGKDVGGDFKNVPLCGADDQTGCVVPWASFAADAPPPADSYFGIVRGRDGVAACVNPAALGGGTATLKPYFPTTPRSSILTALGATETTPQWADPSKGPITTPFVTLTDTLTAKCVTKDGATYLAVSVNGDASAIPASAFGAGLTPQWGLHLVDVNLVMGNLDEVIQSQAQTYESQ